MKIIPKGAVFKGYIDRSFDIGPIDYGQYDSLYISSKETFARRGRGSEFFHRMLGRSRRNIFSFRILRNEK